MAAASNDSAGSKQRDYNTEKDKLRLFLNTFHTEGEDGRKVFKYQRILEQVAEREITQLQIDIDDLRLFDENEGTELASAAMRNARRYAALIGEVVYDLIPELKHRPIVKDALDVYIEHRLEIERKAQIEAGVPANEIDPRKNYPAELLRRFDVVFKPADDVKIASVREIRADSIGKLVTVCGIVTRATEVKPRMRVATYTCDVCGSETFQPVLGPSFMPALNCPGEACRVNKAGGRLLLQTRGSKFVRFQEIRVQEKSDQVPMGHVPRAMTVHVMGDVTRQCLPGDQVEITGIFLPLLKSGFSQIAQGLLSETYLEAHSIKNLNVGADDDLAKHGFEMTEEEVELFSAPDLYDRLAASIAPEIYGHVDIKKALLLLLVGGVDRVADDSKIRGCINILLMGDPGMAKSQLLIYIDRIAPRSQYTTGRGSSGVGLTAAVLKDPLTGEMTLEGGALVLADQGICCIDEFDKMMDYDRTAIHEVMEQQTISIAKAGIMTRLNARVSVLAAANPAFGRYNPRRTVEQNVQLPAALLSRFDLLYLMQDVADKDTDLRLAHHITEVHRLGHEPGEKTLAAIKPDKLRRYVSLCKMKMPFIPAALDQMLVDTYVELRNEGRNNKNTTYTSARNLLAVIRMSTALARLRLADEVVADDIKEAVRLVEASKASLQAQGTKKSKTQRPVDLIFAAVRDLVHGADEDGSVSVAEQEAWSRCQARGFTRDQFQEFLETYEDQNIIMMNEAKTKITFVHAV